MESWELALQGNHVGFQANLMWGTGKFSELAMEWPGAQQGKCKKELLVQIPLQPEASLHRDDPQSGSGDGQQS